MSIKEFSESATGFTKNPLGIIALFIILVYAFASLVVGFGQSLENYVAPLIYFMVFFPVIVFLGFLWLVANHHNKLYGPSDFRNEDNFFKAYEENLLSSTYLEFADKKNQASSGEFHQGQFDQFTELALRTKKPISSESWKNRVLWVDDHPEKNMYERLAFEKQGLKFRLATSTNEAIQILKQEKFAVIISDMNREEGSEAGYVLLEQLKLSRNSTPVVIYTGYTGLKSVDKRKASEYRALGSTNRPQELFRLVMEVVRNNP